MFWNVVVFLILLILEGGIAVGAVNLAFMLLNAPSNLAVIAALILVVVVHAILLYVAVKAGKHLFHVKEA